MHSTCGPKLHVWCQVPMCSPLAVHIASARPIDPRYPEVPISISIFVDLFDDLFTTLLSDFWYFGVFLVILFFFNFGLHWDFGQFLVFLVFFGIFGIFSIFSIFGIFGKFWIFIAHRAIFKFFYKGRL